MKLPTKRFPPIPLYINKRFGSKENFLLFLDKKTGIKFKKDPYPKLLVNIYDKIGKQKLFSLLNIHDENEAELRTYLFDALYKGLVEASWGRQLSPLYEKITGNRVRIRRKSEKKRPAYEIAFFSDEKAFTQAWIDLFNKKVLPVTYHFDELTVGALGWLKASYPRYGYSTAFRIIYEKFDKNSREVILGTLFNTVKQIAKNPKKYHISSYLSKQLRKNLKKVNAEKDDTLRYMMILQLIETYLDDDVFGEVINTLIAKEYVKPPKVRGLYERFPYSFSNWIITRYGVFKLSSSWLRKPVEELAELLQKKVRPKYLEPELEPYHGDYPLKILEYCILGNPEEILKNIGAFGLREIAEELGVSAATKIKDESTIIRLILLKLGFNLPPILYGLKVFEELINKCSIRLKKNEPVSSLMSDIYGAAGTILLDLNYFYACYLWNIHTRQRRPNEIEFELTEIVRNLKVSNKPFLKLTFGEHVKFLRTLNLRVQKDSTMRTRFSEAFNRNSVVPQGLIKILDEISAKRSSLFAHKDIEQIIKRPNLRICKEIISKVEEFCKILREKEIYPHLIRITKQVTNEYGIQYFKAVDDFGNDWIVEYSWLDPSKPYFMYTKTNPVAIDPIIIQKIF